MSQSDWVRPTEFKMLSHRATRSAWRSRGGRQSNHVDFAGCMYPVVPTLPFLFCRYMSLYFVLSCHVRWSVAGRIEMLSHRPPRTLASKVFYKINGSSRLRSVVLIHLCQPCISFCTSIISLVCCLCPSILCPQQCLTECGQQNWNTRPQGNHEFLKKSSKMFAKACAQTSTGCAYLIVPTLPRQLVCCPVVYLCMCISTSVHFATSLSWPPKGDRVWPAQSKYTATGWREFFVKASKVFDKWLTQTSTGCAYPNMTNFH